MAKKSKKWLRRINWKKWKLPIIAASVGFAIFLLYCASLFHDITILMSQAPESKPTIIYSDVYTLKKGDLYSNSFLKERLDDLKLSYTDVEEGIRWRARKFDVPDAILPKDSPLRQNKDATIQVVIKEDHVDSIFVDGQEHDSIALEPAVVARLSGQATEIREYLPLSDIPTRLPEAIIAIEDQRFLEHFGFDPRSFFRAMWVNLRTGSMAQGGSTLTQQLVKNLLGTRQKTFTRKIKELVLAVLLEIRYSKEEILEKYLNEVYFGQIGSLEVHGVSEAARYFFGKPVKKLTLAETAMIAGIIRGPVLYSPHKNLKRSLDRRNTVLRKMFELNLITKKELSVSLAEKPTLAPTQTASNRAPYFVDYVKAQLLEELGEQFSNIDLSSESLKIYTTLDLPLQHRADAAVSKGVVDLETRFKLKDPVKLEGLLVSADPLKGFVRALVGGRSYTQTTFNRVLNMKRHVGSSFKPICYLAAIMKGHDAAGVPFSPAYMVVDEPWTYKYDDKEWSPKNYEKPFRGKITLWEAAVNSINVPMAKIATDVGIEEIADLAEKLGVTSRLPRVPSLALGAVELSAMELLQVYTVFANRGEKVDFTTIRAVVDASGTTIARFNPQPVQVVEPKYVDVLNAILHGVTTEGTSKILPVLGFKKRAWGKTGTTNYSRDSWFNGFSNGLLTITWVGFDELKIPDEDDEKAIKKFKSPANLTGASAALPVWASYMNAALPSLIDAPEPPVDSSLDKLHIDRKTGCKTDMLSPENSFEALFLPGTAPGC